MENKRLSNLISAISSGSTLLIQKHLGQKLSLENYQFDNVEDLFKALARDGFTFLDMLKYTSAIDQGENHTVSELG